MSVGGMGGVDSEGYGGGDRCGESNGYGGEDDRDVSTGHIPLVEGSGVDSDGLLRGTVGGGVHVAGGGTDTQDGRELPRHRPGGGGVEGSGGSSQFLPHHLHRLPQRPPWFPGVFRHQDRLP